MIFCLLGTRVFGDALHLCHENGCADHSQSLFSCHAQSSLCCCETSSFRNTNTKQVLPKNHKLIGWTCAFEAHRQKLKNQLSHQLVEGQVSAEEDNSPKNQHPAIPLHDTRQCDVCQVLHVVAPIAIAIVFTPDIQIIALISSVDQECPRFDVLNWSHIRGPPMPGESA